MTQRITLTLHDDSAIETVTLSDSGFGLLFENTITGVEVHIPYELVPAVVGAMKQVLSMPLDDEDEDDEDFLFG